MNEIVTKTKTETSSSTDDKSVAISYLKNKEKFVELYNKKEKKYCSSKSFFYNIWNYKNFRKIY